MIIRDPDEVEREAVELILTKPVFIGFSEETIRVRRNLLTIAFFVVVYKLSELEINIFSFLGTTFKEDKPSKEFLDISLFLLVLYHLIHFGWQSIDAWKECRLRVTGTNALFMKNDIAKESTEDYAFDPRQSSLLNWLWKRTQLDSMAFDALVEEMSIRDTHLFGKHDYNRMDVLSNIYTLNKAINDNRTLVSLNRFEEFYEGFAWSQILRWCILEFWTPVGLALFAMSQTYQALLIWVLNFPNL